MEKNSVVLYGASGHCKVVFEILESNNRAILAVIDDAPKVEFILGKIVVKTIDFDFSTVKEMIIAIGNNKTRKEVVNKLILNNFVPAIHTTAIVSNSAKVGKGSVVMAGVIVNAEAVIGDHCIINTGAVVEHDCVIANYAHISPNVSLAGNVCVGEGTHIGIGASIVQGIKIGKWATIGAGSVIISDIPDYAVVVGVPGKIIKFNINNE